MIGKANRLGKTTSSSISAGKYRFTTLINMSRSIVFGGKQENHVWNKLVGLKTLVTEIHD